MAVAHCGMCTPHMADLCLADALVFSCLLCLQFYCCISHFCKECRVHPGEWEFDIIIESKGKAKIYWKVW